MCKNECGESLKKEFAYWCKCTACNYFDICVSCYKDGIHKQHANQFSWFDEPLQPEEGSCEACGLKFHLDRK